MFDTIIKFLEDQIEQLESEGKRQEELFLGVSNLNDEVHEKLKTLGWRATYVEQGFFQLSRL